jgi:hypothetical protein
MDERYIERALRDLLRAEGLEASILRVHRFTDGWVVTMTDESDRVVSTRIDHSSPDAICAALSQWLETTQL